MPTQVRNAAVLQIEKLGSYHRLRVVAPAIAEAVRPGHFVAFSVGGSEGGLLLRRAFSVLPAPERRRLGSRLKEPKGVRPLNVLFIDAERAQPALATVARLLGSQS